MPRRLPPHVERNHVKGKTYLSFRVGKGPRIRLPDNPTSEPFQEAYTAALLGESAPRRHTITPGTIEDLIVSYKKSRSYAELRSTTKTGYASRIEALRIQHGHRIVAGMTAERIEDIILAPYRDRPSAMLNILKMMRILTHFAMGRTAPQHLKLLHDPCAGIERPKTGEIRAWTDAELAAYERLWPLGTKQRTAYALMLHVGAARVDVHRMTWTQIDEINCGVTYTRNKTGVPVEIGLADELRRALDKAPRNHITIINTEFGRPFTAAGFSRFMRDAIGKAGLPLACKPHGLRKTLGRRLADASVTVHEIMAALGHRTLGEAERYTREADRRRGGREAVRKLELSEKQRANSQTAAGRLEKRQKRKENQS